MIETEVEKMEDGKEKELMKILNDGGKPYIKKHDGYAVKCNESKEIEYKDYDGSKLTLAVPEGSYVVTDGDSKYPKIVPADEFEKKNKFIESSKKENPKKDNNPKTGLDAMDY